MPRKPKNSTIPTTFTPGFLAGLDHRTKTAQLLKANRDAIIEDLGGEVSVSRVKNALVERFVWLEALLQSIEAEMAASQSAKPELISRWIQAVNSLSGLAKALGIERANTARSIEALYAADAVEKIA